MEFLNIPEHESETLDESQQCFGLFCFVILGKLDFSGKVGETLKKVEGRNPGITSRGAAPTRTDVQSVAHEPLAEEHALFATHGSLGVVDFGATKTITGSDLVADLINHLHPNNRK